MQPETKWTVGELLDWTAKYFAQKKFDSPRLDAEILLAHALKKKRIDLYVSHDQVPEQQLRDAFRELVKQRTEGCPVAYLVGKKEFFGLDFQVNQNVLIPRPDTECLVDAALRLAKKEGWKQILDIGTGSGCIAIALARHLPGVTVCAVDISEKALEVARVNARNHNLEARIEFVCGSLLEPVLGRELFDAIVSNPPYIPAKEIEELEVGVKKYEPRSALDGGPEGLDIISKIIKQAPASLKNGGHLLMEVGAGQADAVTRLIKNMVGLESLATISDGAQIQRVVHARKNSW